jgi:uncharacterized membrane protein YsdA (DUF1294 family)
MTVLAYPAIANSTNWDPYYVWLAALSVTTFVVYGLDKLLSTINNAPRIPELLLHALAILGGFPGGWAGMIVFHHKTNIHEKADFPIILALSTVGHLALIHYITT